MKDKKNMKNRAFTLIELLVVISIIAVLMAILLPSLGMARNQCKAATCMSNLRQLVLAAQNYISSNNEFYPPSYVFDPDPTDNLSIYADWDFTRIQQSGQLSVEPGLLWLDKTIDKIQQCPVFKGPANSDVPYCGYNYNTSFIGRGKAQYPYPAKVTDIKRPTKCIIFGDGEFYAGANKHMRSPFKSPFDRFSYRATGTQGFRHNSKTNIAWCDGHVSAQKEYYTETIPGEKVKLDKYNETARVKIGFISPDNSAYDLK